jgi:DNA repair protein RecN (Recombination protein N)
VQERRAELGRLIRQFGDTAGVPSGEPAAGGEPAASGVSAVLSWAQRAEARLAELEGDDDRITGLAEEETALAAEVGLLAGQLTAARKEAADRFAADVTAELAALAMPHARLMVALTPLREAGPHGADEIEIRLSAHPGAPALPLHKGASGGELSRVMLAIEVVFAGADPVPTFVFDEVDAGVGGKAAVEVGRRLARLARLAQVIVVTHLPQVAAFADTHLVLEKADDGSVTRSGVTRLDRGGRVKELSRMLAGLEDSEFGRAHAEELLAAAAAERVGG